jgi:hypothetical protein
MKFDVGPWEFFGEHVLDKLEAPNKRLKENIDDNFEGNAEEDAADGDDDGKKPNPIALQQHRSSIP